MIVNTNFDQFSYTKAALGLPGRSESQIKGMCFGGFERDIC